MLDCCEFELVHKAAEAAWGFIDVWRADEEKLKEKHGRTKSTNDQVSLNHRIWFVVHEYASGAPVKLKIHGI